MKKKYRKIPSLKYLYEISNDGEIRNVKSKKILKQLSDKDGYMIVCIHITSENINCPKRIHRLVAECWCNPPENWKELQVNHKDYNVKNNYYKNLEWVTCQENLDYSLERRIKSIKLNHSKNIYFIENGITYEFNSSVPAAKYVASITGKNNLSTIERQLRYAASGKWNHYAYGKYWYNKSQPLTTIPNGSKVPIDTVSEKVQPNNN